MELSKEEKIILLSAARKSIENLFSKTEIVQPDYNIYPNLKLHAGAFVTLTINKDLRGCIGYIISNKKLFDTVCDAAIQAAIGDPRFPKLSKAELSKISMEISVLSPPFKMNNYDEIVIGKHGLIVEENYHRGLLLPQVPIEHKMNKEEFLSALCHKAGLESNLWRKKILNIQMFTANVFSEEDFHD